MRADQSSNGLAIVMGENSHVSSFFAGRPDETGQHEEVTVADVKAVIARQLLEEMKKKSLTKTRMAALMKTSRTQVDRLLDPENGNATTNSLQRAAKAVGRELQIQLV